MTNDSSPHSGSRWEPTTGPTEHPTAVDPQTPPSQPAVSGQPTPDNGPVAAEGRRRRRGPVLAVLAAVLTLGASTAGIAYVSATEPAGGDPAAPVSRTADGAPGDRAAGDSDSGERAAGDRAAGERGAGDEDRARTHGHHDGDDDHESGDDRGSGDQDDDGQPS